MHCCCFLIRIFAIWNPKLTFSAILSPQSERPFFFFTKVISSFKRSWTVIVVTYFSKSKCAYGIGLDNCRDLWTEWEYGFLVIPLPNNRSLDLHWRTKCLNQHCSPNPNILELSTEQSRQTPKPRSPRRDCLRVFLFLIVFGYGQKARPQTRISINRT